MTPRSALRDAVNGARAALRFGADVLAGEANAVERSATDMSGEASSLPPSFEPSQSPKFCEGFSPKLRISLKVQNCARALARSSVYPLAVPRRSDQVLTGGGWGARRARSDQILKGGGGGLDAGLREAWPRVGRDQILKGSGCRAR